MKVDPSASALLQILNYDGVVAKTRTTGRHHPCEQLIVVRLCLVCLWGATSQALSIQTARWTDSTVMSVQ